MHEHSVGIGTPATPVGITRRLALRVLPLAVAVALTLGVAGSPEPASARDNLGVGVSAGCVYKGQSYSHGSIVKMDNGFYYICNNGTWDFHSSTPRPRIGDVGTIDLTPSTAPVEAAQP